MDQENSSKETLINEINDLRRKVTELEEAKKSLQQTEEELRESEERIRQIISSAQFAIIIMDDEGKVSFWNKAAENIFGYSFDEIIGKDLHSYLAPEQYVIPFKDSFERFRDTGKGPFIGQLIELEAKKKDGTVFSAEISLSAFKLKGKWNSIGIIIDISDRKNLEKKVMQTLGKLSASNEDLEKFAYIASHDLQEPLRMVSSYLGLLSKRYKDKLDKDADEFIGFAVDGAERMSALLSGLLKYSRVGSRAQPFEKIDCEEILQQALRNLKIAIEENDAEITYDKLPSIKADGTQLVQLFQNLIANAVKFKGDKSPRIHVSAEKDGNYWVFSIKDNGIGINAGDHERIFMIFQRLHTRNEYSGTGIGLAICKKIVERHGGRIWVNSQPGEGSTFFFNIPTETEEI